MITFNSDFTYSLILYNNIYLDLPYFHVSYNTLFFTEYIVTLFLHRRGLDTFHVNNRSPGLTVHIAVYMLIISQLKSNVAPRKR